MSPMLPLPQQKIGSKTNSCSLFCLYLGFNKDVEAFGVKYYSNVFQGEDVKTLKDIKPNHLGDWSKRSFIFVDYNKVDAQLAPPDKSVGCDLCRRLSEKLGRAE
jgi:all-trans-retinol 13,14-reductase